jgi:hypothetical protein
MPEGQAGIHSLVEKRPAEFALGGVLGPNDGRVIPRAGFADRHPPRGGVPTMRPPQVLNKSRTVSIILFIPGPEISCLGHL